MISFMIQFMSPQSSQNDGDRNHNSHYLWGWDPEQETGGGREGAFICKDI